MRSTLILCLSLALTHCVNNEGRVVDTWANGHVKTRKIFLTEKDTAQFMLLSYYQSGQIKEQSRFLSNTKNGWSLTFHENGKVEDSTFYRDNVSIITTSHYYSNGVILSRGQFNELGNEDGLWMFYDSLGRLVEESLFVNGQKSETTFFDGFGWMIQNVKFLEGAGGLPAEILNYNDSTLHGEYFKYFITGNISTIGRYDHGKQDSIWTEYYNTGGKYREIRFEKAEYVSKGLNMWNEEGIPTVKNGNGTHTTFEYCPNGMILYKITTKYFEGYPSKAQTKSVNHCGAKK